MFAIAAPRWILRNAANVAEGVSGMLHHASTRHRLNYVCAYNPCCGAKPIQFGAQIGERIFEPVPTHTSRAALPSLQ